MTLIRLQKYLADQGIASRRGAEDLIKQGRIKVNNKVVREMGVKVDSQDKVFFDGQLISKQKPNFRYIMLNKPVGYLSTVKSGREIGPTVMSLLPKNERLYPIGRLDKNTSGLLLFTNDGDLALKLTHPRYEKEKEYEVEVKDRVTSDFLQQLRQGVLIDGELTLPAKVRPLNSHKFKIIIKQGRKRQIRLMCQVLGNKVINLKRLRINNLLLDNLPEGKWRELTAKEIAQLKK